MGTVRANRGVPKELVSFNWKLVSTEFARKNNSIVAKYVDNRDVYVMSNRHSVELVQMTRNLREQRQMT